MARRCRYGRRDGRQAGFELDAEGVLGEIADDLLYHGDLKAALRRTLQSGMRTPHGCQLEGAQNGNASMSHGPAIGGTPGATSGVVSGGSGVGMAPLGCGAVVLHTFSRR